MEMEMEMEKKKKNRNFQQYFLNRSPNNLIYSKKKEYV